MKKKSMVNVLCIVIITLSMLFGSCSFSARPSQSGTPSASQTPAPSNDTTGTATPPPTESQTPTPAPSEQGMNVDEILKSMTLEEKVGQLFFVASRYNANGQGQLELDDSLKNTLKEFKPGGFIFFSENIETIPQTTAFVKSIQEQTEIPLFIGIDEEGGIVTRLNKASSLHSTVMPAPFSIGSTNDPQNAYLDSKYIAEEIKSLGFNLDFAPVADIFSNPKNKIIGKRSFGTTPDLVSSMVSSSVKGFHDTGIIPVLKHFPGHGDTLQDSHTGAAVVENDLTRLESFEFEPFRAGIAAGAEVVMTGHLLTPKITNDGLPATLDPQIVNGILRNELGFDGVVITDGLEMSAISKYYTEEEAVVMAIKAGVDMLLLPKNLDKSYHAIINAVNNGEISEERIDESVRRILELKMKYLYSKTGAVLDPEKVLGSEEHRSFADRIRKEASK